MFGQPNFFIADDVPGVPGASSWIRVSSGKVLCWEREITQQFGYYGKHVSENTLLGSGGFGAEEISTDGSPLSRCLWALWKKVRTDPNCFETLRVVHDTRRVLDQFWESYRLQHGTHAGTFGKDLEAIYGVSGRIRRLAGFVPIVVEYHLSHGKESRPYNQTYLIWLNPEYEGDDRNRWFSEILLGTRNSLYSLFERMFHRPYPADEIYRTHDTEGFARRIRREMVRPTSCMHGAFFQKAVSRDAVRIVERIGMDYLIEIMETSKRILMKSDGSFEEVS